MTLPDTMHAVLLTGHGGLEKLDYRTDVAVPEPSAGEVLIQISAAGINNTDINTRIGWYSKGVSSATESGGATGFGSVDDADASWFGTPLTFPRIQGADVCGIIVSVGEGVREARLGERVLVRNMLRSYVDFRPYEFWTMGSECDGGLRNLPWPRPLRHMLLCVTGRMQNLPPFPAPTPPQRTCCTARMWARNGSL